MGCHIVLVDGIPLVRDAATQTLLDGSSSIAGTPRFREGIGKFAALALLGRLAPDEIEAEATAQIRKLQSSGIAVTHLDSHKHTHMFPHVFRPLLRAAKACGVTAIRNPFERIRGSEVASRPALWQRWAEVGILRGLVKQFREAVREAGYDYARRNCGHRCDRRARRAIASAHGGTSSGWNLGIGLSSRI